MWLPERCSHLGEIDIQQFTEVLEQLPEKMWNVDEHVKHKIAGNRQTRSLFLQILTSDEFLPIIQKRALLQQDVTRYSAWDELQEPITPLLDFALSHFPTGGVIVRVQLARMMPGAKIGEHKDTAALLAVSYRLHIPIKTNSEVHFIVDNERITMQEGNLYNLNNRVSHWVENRGNEERIHLIVDYVPPENNNSEVLLGNYDRVLKKRHFQLVKNNVKCHPAFRKRKLPKLITTSVIRGANQNQSHGGVFIVDMGSETAEQVVDWNTGDIDFQGRGWDRGLRGIAIHGENIYIAASNELYLFDKSFNIIQSFKNSYLQHAHEIFIFDENLYVTSTGYDSVLRFDLRSKSFDNGWLFRRSLNGRMEIKEYKPIAPYGPAPGNSLHINSVFYNQQGLHVSGRNLTHILRFEPKGCESIANIPTGTHNAITVDSYLLYNDTNEDKVAIESSYDYFEFDVPAYQTNKLENFQLGDEKLARQSFGRGLTLSNDGVLYAGSSPSTISAYDLEQKQIIKTVNLSMDVRNAIHGLEIWPF